MKIYAITGSIFYVFFVIWYFHYNAIRRDYPRLSAGEAMNEAVTDIFVNPFDIFPITSSSVVNLILITFLAASLLAIIIAEHNLKKHDNPDTVNGDAHLMNTAEYREYEKKFASPLGQPGHDGANNMIISKDIRLAIDNRGTRRNCNILVIGGSGAGKSRFFAAPNILQYNCNFVITDPSGEMLRDYGKALEDNGYQVKVFNLTDVYRSNRYNPFHYIRYEKDVFILVETLIRNTTGDGKSGEKFWEDSEKLLLTALILYLWHTAPPEDQTFANVVKLINLADIDENDASAESTLDQMFNDLENSDPENLAVQQYKSFKLAAGKTLKSILISVAVRLQSFKLSDIKYLTSADDFFLERFGDTKQALFVIIPTADKTFNFLVSLLYSQLFMSLYDYSETKAEFGWKLKYDDMTNIRVYQADDKKESKQAKQKCEELLKDIKTGVKVKYDDEKKLYRVYTKKGKQLIGWRGTKEAAKEFVRGLTGLKIEQCEAKCPIHVRLILDEFANIGQIPNFNEKLATMRKYEISCSIILQSIAQLKTLYKDQWSTITGNCDTYLFLGCNEQETIKWMIDPLGKETTTVKNESYQATGNGGSMSLNKSSRELVTVDQLTMMPDDYCFLRIRGVRPYYGKKYELTEHPNYDYAQKTKGTFEVPLSDDARFRKSGPYWKRRKEEQAKLKAAAASAEESNPQNISGTAAKPVQKQEEIPGQDIGFAPQDVTPSVKTGIKTPQKSDIKPFNAKAAKNGARKKEADEARNDLNNFDDDFGAESQEMVAQAMCASLGLDENSTPAQIKESAESYVMLLGLPEQEMEFDKTE
jgi:type IV secretory pathway TraG/TraD family ATPase VirD4